VSLDESEEREISSSSRTHRLPLLPISTALAKAAPLSASLLASVNQNPPSFEVPAKSRVDIFIWIRRFRQPKSDHRACVVNTLRLHLSLLTELGSSDFWRRYLTSVGDPSPVQLFGRLWKWSWNFSPPSSVLVITLSSRDSIKATSYLLFFCLFFL
jgi:hypothetical protein